MAGLPAAHPRFRIVVGQNGVDAGPSAGHDGGDDFDGAEF
jgi:hypothetical protein